ncbi:hypothetical protein J3E68DRAFT_401136 [Trichoderma sp. SZMC 28012]
MQLKFGLLSSAYQCSLTLRLLLPNGSQAAIKEYHVRVNLKSLLALSIDTTTRLYVSALPLVTSSSFGGGP